MYPVNRHEIYSKTFNLIGVNHKTLPLESRELLPKIEKESGPLLESIVSSCRLKEAALLSTCNRFEIISVGEDREDEIFDFLAKKVDFLSRSSFYSYKNSEAVKHLFRVAASLDSMVVGEGQIIHQVKEAYEKASNNGLAGKHLHHLFQFAFSLAKRIKTQTRLSRQAVSISYVAVKLAEQILGDLSESRVLIIGSGRMAELAAVHLKSHGCRRIIVANRTLAKAVQLAESVGGSAVALDKIASVLSQSDIVIGSISCDDYIISRETIEEAKIKHRVFLIDLGVPRNFEPEISNNERIYLYNIDDLSETAQRNRSVRDEAAKEAELIIDYGLIQFERWLAKTAKEPLIKDMREIIRDICHSEVERSLHRESSLDSREGQLELSHRISRKIAHELTHTLLESNGDLLDAEFFNPLVMDDDISHDD